MGEVKRYYIGAYSGEAEARTCSPHALEIVHQDDGRYFVLDEDFDRVTAERDAERRRADVAVADANDAEAAGKKVSELLANRTAERDAAKETLERWHELNLQREAKVDSLQQRLTAADERADVLEGLLRDVREHPSVLEFACVPNGWIAKRDAALKPAEGGGDEA